MAANNGHIEAIEIVASCIKKVPDYVGRELGIYYWQLRLQRIGLAATTAELDAAAGAIADSAERADIEQWEAQWDEDWARDWNELRVERRFGVPHTKLGKTAC